MKVIKKNEAIISLDGPEVCREYLATGKVTFGSSTLLPGQTGGIDPGHPQSHEVFYVSRGHVIMHNTETSKFYELTEGDIILVEEGEPHELTNIGMEPAVITWSCAPSDIKE
ncbi:cupin domain-containing protein [Mediterraneibacter sp. NSJ-55]|uniref:Cupin domain-containing protein n=1 Tax=Mediterraneibacter hominis TaxID=2763054 RepID=A0A923RQT9_9FIRM|nr:cupin domain-containing protein [Mediterraneibacter hominis]MBC5689866.1 cupin domain-containing protein [Mediterraneibacter hominis]